MLPASYNKLTVNVAGTYKYTNIYKYSTNI